VLKTCGIQAAAWFLLFDWAPIISGMPHFRKLDIRLRRFFVRLTKRTRFGWHGNPGKSLFHQHIRLLDHVVAHALQVPLLLGGLAVAFGVGGPDPQCMPARRGLPLGIPTSPGKGRDLPAQAGIGSVVTEDDPYCGVDLDHCVDPAKGQIEPWAREIVEELNSYTDFTPSGTGPRVFLKAKLPATRRKKGDFEVYETGRFLTVTGNHPPGTPLIIEDRQTEMNQVHLRRFGPQRPSGRVLIDPGHEGDDALELSFPVLRGASGAPVLDENLLEVWGVAAWNAEYELRPA